MLPHDHVAFKWPLKSVAGSCLHECLTCRFIPIFKDISPSGIALDTIKWAHATLDVLPTWLRLAPYWNAAKELLASASTESPCYIKFSPSPLFWLQRSCWLKPQGWVLDGYWYHVLERALATYPQRLNDVPAVIWRELHTVGTPGGDLIVLPSGEANWCSYGSISWLKVDRTPCETNLLRSTRISHLHQHKGYSVWHAPQTNKHVTPHAKNIALWHMRLHYM